MKRVLFVDDEPAVLDGIRRIIERADLWGVEFAASAEKALSLLAESAFDVIVCDLRMPAMDGPALLKIVCEKYPAIVRIVLSGQTELEFLLKQPALRQLRQRISLRCRMTPLTLRDTRGYVSERLRIAGAQGDPIFGPGALETVFRYSGGIPRVINLLCEHALITAFAEGEKPVLADTILAVAREFELDGPPKLIVPTQEAAKASAV